MKHQIEEQLEHQVKETQRYPDIQMRIQEHLDATKQHRERMAQCLDSYERKPSAVKGAMSGMMGNLFGALSAARTDSPAKTARGDYMVEHMEIAAYELLIATAQLCGESGTVRTGQLNLADEVRMAYWLEQNLPKTAILSLGQGGIAVDQQAMLDASDTAVRALRSAQGQVGQLGQLEVPPIDQLDQTAQPVRHGLTAAAPERRSGPSSRGTQPPNGRDAMTHNADQDAQTRQSQQPSAANEAGPDAWGQQGDPGMLGASGDMANVDRQEHAAPIGVPDVPGTVNSPGTVRTAGAPGTPSKPKQADVLGTTGNVRGAEPANQEPGTPGVPGTPVPAPMGGQLASDKLPETPGPQSPSPADMSVGDTPTPGPASGQGDAATQPHYGTSGTPGLGGASPTGDGADGTQRDAPGEPEDEHVVADEHGIRSTGPVSGTDGTGVERLGGMPGGTSNYGGIGSPGDSTGLGTGRGSKPDARDRGERGGGLGTGGQVVSGSGGPAGTRVLPGGATRPGSAASDEDNQDDPVALARQAGDSALNTGPSSTGGTLQRAPGTPGANSAPASPYPGIVASNLRPAGGGGTAVPGGQEHEQKDKHMEHMRSDQPHPDEKSGTGMGAAANDVDRGGAEAATRARSGGGPTIGGSPPPNGAPPAPVNPDPYGGTISESRADPGFPPPVPEQPTPGLTREPGPEAHT